MTITVYTSADAGAPSLTGVAGSLVTVLDAVLVNGYGAKPAAGWTKPFSGTNQAVYRPAAQDRLFLNVDDSTAHFASLVGYETMSAFATGTGLFPTALQLSTGVFCMKSSTASATVRPWLAIADGAAIHFFSFCAQTVFGLTSTIDGGFFFGALKSYKAGDAYSTTLIGSISSTINTATGQQAAARYGTSFAGASGHYTARSYTQLGSALQCHKVVPTTSLSTALVGSTIAGDTLAPTYPDPVSGGVSFVPVIVMEAAGVYRGQLPGAFSAWSSVVPLGHLDTITGTGDFAGVTFLSVASYATTSAGRFYIQTSGSWY